MNETTHSSNDSALSLHQMQSNMTKHTNKQTNTKKSQIYEHIKIQTYKNINIQRYKHTNIQTKHRQKRDKHTDRKKRT